MQEHSKYMKHETNVISKTIQLNFYYLHSKEKGFSIFVLPSTTCNWFM